MKRPNRGSYLCRIPVRAAWLVVSLACLHSGFVAQGQETFAAAGLPIPHNVSVPEKASACRIIYLGFVGALEPANNKYSGVVQIRKTLQEKEYSDVCAKSFSPYVWMDGRDWLLKHFPAHSGALTPAELQQSPKVILVGHSMGGWAMMSVARELRSREIPVELTIQVDSVGLTDETIPRNVKSAAIFHANDVLMALTTKHLRREDASRTTIVENVTVAGAGHESITRDPRIRELVMKMIEKLRMAPPVETTTSESQPPAATTHGADQR